MPYASLEDLIERAGEKEILQIADRDRDGAPDPDVTEAALVHADNIVNGYIAAKYSLPLPQVPDLVRTWSVAIARHKLHRNGPPSYVVDDMQEAISQLKDVARGAMVLSIPTGEEPETTSGSFNASSPDEVFNDRFLRGW